MTSDPALASLAAQPGVSLLWQRVPTSYTLSWDSQCRIPPTGLGGIPKVCQLRSVILSLFLAVKSTKA